MGSKYYGKSNYDLFFELIKINQFTCKLYTSYKPSQYILLINLIHFIEKICKIYEPIAYIFRTQFVNFISKLYTCYGSKLYILLKNTIKCAFNTTVKICSFCSISHGEICSQNQWKPCLNYCGIWNTDKISRIYQQNICSVGNNILKELADVDKPVAETAGDEIRTLTDEVLPKPGPSRRVSALQGKFRGI